MKIYRFLSLSISSFRSQKVSGNEEIHYGHVILLEPLTQREKSPAEGEEKQPYPDIHDVHTPSYCAWCFSCETQHFLHIRTC
jgi:hypothetical protein